VSGPFEPGERVLLVDQRGRRYLVRLQAGQTWHSHGGTLPHDLILGSPEGTVVHSASGMVFRCFRPRMADFVLKMPRGAQVIYPKDLGPILMLADLFPGARTVTLADWLAQGPPSCANIKESREQIDALFGSMQHEGLWGPNSLAAALAKRGISTLDELKPKAEADKFLREAWAAAVSKVNTAAPPVPAQTKAPWA
jgi:hypothetical protein